MSLFTMSRSYSLFQFFLYCFKQLPRKNWLVVAFVNFVAVFYQSNVGNISQHSLNRCFSKWRSVFAFQAKLRQSFTQTSECIFTFRKFLKSSHNNFCFDFVWFDI